MLNYDLKDIHNARTIVIVNNSQSSSNMDTETLVNDILLAKHVHTKDVHDMKLNADALSNILEQQRTAIENKQEDVLHQWIILSQRTMELNDTDTNNVFANGRCIKVGLILSLSDLTTFSGFKAGNTDYMFVHRECSKAIVKKINEIYGYTGNSVEMFGSFTTFKEIFRIHKEFTWLVLDCTSLNPSLNLQNTMYLY